MRLTFSGIAFYRRDFLAFVGSGESDIKPWWRAALKGGARVRVEDCTGAAWHDFGTPQGLWEAARHRMEQTGTYAYRYAVGEGARAEREDARPRVANEAGPAELPSDLRNVVVYETPRVPLEAGTANLLTGYDFDWKIRP